MSVCTGAAAFPLAVYATRRAWTAVSHTLFPPALDAGRLTDLCHMTQLEWLEVKSSTMPTPEEWSAALRPLTRLRRLDVRNTSFRDPHALQACCSYLFLREMFCLADAIHSVQQVSTCTEGSKLHETGSLEGSDDSFNVKNTYAHSSMATSLSFITIE